MDAPQWPPPIEDILLLLHNGELVNNTLSYIYVPLLICALGHSHEVPYFPVNTTPNLQLWVHQLAPTVQQGGFTYAQHVHNNYIQAPVQEAMMATNMQVAQEVGLFAIDLAIAARQEIVRLYNIHQANAVQPLAMPATAQQPGASHIPAPSYIAANRARNARQEVIRRRQHTQRQTHDHHQRDLRFLQRQRIDEAAAAARRAIPAQLHAAELEAHRQQQRIDEAAMAARTAITAQLYAAQLEAQGLQQRIDEAAAAASTAVSAQLTASQIAREQQAQWAHQQQQQQAAVRAQQHELEAQLQQQNLLRIR
jgi:hypothetical protein